jgi:hypothetical protein
VRRVPRQRHDSDHQQQQRSWSPFAFFFNPKYSKIEAGTRLVAEEANDKQTHVKWHVKQH